LFKIFGDRLRYSFRALLAAALVLAPISPASATTVTPVIVDLQSNGRGVVANISVNNTGAGPLPIEIEIIPLAPSSTGLQPAKAGAADEDLLVTPPSVLIPAGKTQTFRVQWVGDPELASSKHYYVSINQLPVKLPEGESAVQVVYNFQVLVSVSSPNRKPQLAITAVAPAVVDGKSVAAVTVQNNGQAHGYISQHRLKIAAAGPGGAEVFSKTISGAEFQQLVGYGLVATGQTRTINVPMDKAAPAGAKLTAVLLDERAQ
jgi:P pilus assembly chaperone PapD